jgi:hypothetical protein
VKFEKEVESFRNIRSGFRVTFDVCVLGLHLNGFVFLGNIKGNIMSLHFGYKIFLGQDSE